MSRYLGRDYLQPDPSILSGTSSPDGVVSARKGTLYVNTATGSLWVNTDGARAWRPFGAQQTPMTSGRYYFMPRGTQGTSTGLGNGSFRVAPGYVPNQITVSAIGAEVTVAGESGSKVRLGIYADDGTGRPAGLVLDGGQIAGDSVGVQEITGLSTMLPPGLYWFGGAVQSAPSSQPTLRICNPFFTPIIDIGTSTPAAGQADSGFIMTATGALPSTFGTVTTGAANVPRIHIKVA